MSKPHLRLHYRPSGRWWVEGFNTRVSRHPVIITADQYDCEDAVWRALRQCRHFKPRARKP